MNAIETEPDLHHPVVTDTTTASTGAEVLQAAVMTERKNAMKQTKLMTCIDGNARSADSNTNVGLLQNSKAWQTKNQGSYQLTISLLTRES